MFELNFRHAYLPADVGDTFSYFAGCATNTRDAKRAKTFDGAESTWWSRVPLLPLTDSGNLICVVYVDGDWYKGNPTVQGGVVPTLVLNSRSVFDGTTLVLKGVK